MSLLALQQIVQFPFNRLFSSSKSRAFLFQLRRCYSAKCSAKMSSVFVRSVDNDDRLQISLDLKIPKDNQNGTITMTSKTFNLNRLKSEELRLAVERLRLNVGKKMTKKSKKKKTDKTQCEVNKSDDFETTEVQEVPVEILHNGKILDLSVTNECAWVEGAVLRVWEEEISIYYNPPTIKLHNLPKTIMVGFPLFPEAEYEFTDVKNSEFYWKLFDEKHLHKLKLELVKGTLDLTNAETVKSFTPQPGDVGQFMLLSCVPRCGDKLGKMDAVFSTNPVTVGPGLCPFEKRSEFTREFSEDGEFRVLSYNLLAQIYADTDLAKQELFSYCPANVLDMDYRKHLLLKEIIGYKADLLCLQEVDKSIFISHLTPAMQSLGYTGLFREKGDQSSEGCASFFRDDKFQIINQLGIVLSSVLASDPLCADIWSEVCKLASLKDKLEQRSTILQITVAESKERPGNYICLANTHLYFHPSACNVRLIHAAVALRYLQNVCDTYKQEGKNISLVFCGDFNSPPHLGVYQLMTAQFVPSDHVDWSSAGDGELISALELHQTMNIASACGTPPYTNFTKGFKETLDYIFIDSDRLQVTKVVPLPSHEDITANIALPSIVFPSDHLALICDIKFKS